MSFNRCFGHVSRCLFVCAKYSRERNTNQYRSLMSRSRWSRCFAVLVRKRFFIFRDVLLVSFTPFRFCLRNYMHLTSRARLRPRLLIRLFRIRRFKCSSLRFVDAFKTFGFNQDRKLRPIAE